MGQRIEIERQETAERKQKQGQERQKRYERRSEAQKEKEKHFLILEKMIEEAQDIMDKQYDDVFLEKVWVHYCQCIFILGWPPVPKKASISSRIWPTRRSIHGPSRCVLAPQFRMRI
jgi:hypothetical protein